MCSCRDRPCSAPNFGSRLGYNSSSQGRPSQTLTVPSALAEASRDPSGLNARPFTMPVCPLNLAVRAKRHAVDPTGVANQAELWPSPTSGRLHIDVPDLHGPVCAGGGEEPAVGAERH